MAKQSRTQVLLQQLIGKSPGITCRIGNRSGTMYVGTLTPALAAEILEHCNLRNRRIRSGKVRQWTEYQRADLWQPQGYLMFTDFGELIEGQHRAKATAESGLTLQFFVLVRPAAQAQAANRYQDEGVYRTIGDFLRFNDVETPYRVAPVLVIERNERVTGDPLQPMAGTKDQYLVIYREIGSDAFKKTFEIATPKLARQLGLKTQLLDWFTLRAGRVDESAAQLFLGLIQEPSQLAATDPPWVLREYLLDLKNKREGGRQSALSTTQQLTSVAKAWRFFGEGKKVTSPSQIKHRVNEQWPGIFGEE